MAKKESNVNTNKVLNIIVVCMVAFVSIFYAGYYAYQDYLFDVAQQNATTTPPDNNYGVDEA